MTACLDWIRPDWPAPVRVQALTTTRKGGYSRGPYATLNLALHVGDDADAVRANRALLAAEAMLPREPLWLDQVHGARVINADRPGAERRADGSYSLAPGRVCCVLSADCIPVLLCDRHGTRVAALHAGWRGLAAGIIPRGVERLACPARDLLAWLGPAIGPCDYEVDDGLREVFTSVDAGAREAFAPSRPGHWQADLHALARRALRHAGVTAVYADDRSTHDAPEHFYSHRRAAPCGRMASLIWLR